MIQTPNCPMCGQPPAIVLDGGHQCFCQTEDCQVIAWDAHTDRATLLASPRVLGGDDGK